MDMQFDKSMFKVYKNNLYLCANKSATINCDRQILQYIDITLCCIRGIWFVIFCTMGS